MALIALGSVRTGSLVSAAAVPTSSMPRNAKNAIWKPARKPTAPVGKNPPSLTRLLSDATWPSGEVKPVNSITAATAIRATIATILISANQNSISPNSRTAIRFRLSSSAINAVAASHFGTSGHQYWT